MDISTIRKIMTFSLILGLCITIFGKTAFGAGNAEAGKSKAAVCTACHGPDGNSTVPDFPKIAGQIPGYVAEQLAAYKSGKRANAIMAGLVLSMSEQDLLDIDAYYAQFEGSKASIDESELVAANRGQEIYRRGLSQYSVPACMACHGPAGNGIPSRYPKVSGQFKEYLVTALSEFKSGVRVNEEMNTIAFRLSAQQIEDLALYMQALD